MRKLIFICLISMCASVLCVNFEEEEENIGSYKKRCYRSNLILADKKWRAVLENAEAMYEEMPNLIMKAIERAQAKYKPCSATNCSCNMERLKTDLDEFKSGITKEMIDSIKHRGTKYQIFNHILHREVNCPHPSRCLIVENNIKEYLSGLPDMEFIINYELTPQLHREDKLYGPIFSISKNKDYLDILFPSWNFWEGYPTIAPKPSGLSPWYEVREALENLNDIHFFHKKIPVAYLATSRMSEDKRNFFKYATKFDRYFTVIYVSENRNYSNFCTNPQRSLLLHCMYNFLLNFGGNTTSNRFRHLFLCNSLVLHVGNEWIEFFYDSLKPWIHYIPISKEADTFFYKNLIEFLLENMDIAQNISQAGYEHIRNHLRMEDLTCYWQKLLENYAELLRFKIELDSNLIVV